MIRSRQLARPRHESCRRCVQARLQTHPRPQPADPPRRFEPGKTHQQGGGYQHGSLRSAISRRLGAGRTAAAHADRAHPGMLLDTMAKGVFDQWLQQQRGHRAAVRTDSRASGTALVRRPGRLRPTSRAYGHNVQSRLTRAREDEPSQPDFPPHRCRYWYRPPSPMASDCTDIRPGAGSSQMCGDAMVTRGRVTGRGKSGGRKAAATSTCAAARGSERGPLRDQSPTHRV